MILARIRASGQVDQGRQAVRLERDFILVALNETLLHLVRHPLIDGFSGDKLYRVISAMQLRKAAVGGHEETTADGTKETNK